MYYSHFGLNQPPFKITPDTGFFFPGGNRGAVLDALVYAITSGEGIVKVVGEVGSGKTMLCRMLETRLPTGVEIIYLANPSLSRDEILYAIADELGLNLGGQRITVVIRALQAHLIRKYAQGQQVVVFIDEAQAMPPDSLEEIRLLSNLETGTHKLLQIVMFGQPELDNSLSKPQMRQLRERITHGFNLGPFVKPDIRDYLAFRLRAAGYCGPDLFSPGAIKLIAQASQGLIRRINILADKTLLATFAENTHTVTDKHVRAAIRDCEFGDAAPSRRKLAVAAALVGLGLALGAGWHKLASGAPEHVAAHRLGDLQGEVPKQTAAGKVDNSVHVPGPQLPDPLRQRLEESLAWIASGDNSHFAIQLMLVDASASAQLSQKLKRLDQELGSHRVYVYATVANGRKAMNVMYGTFATYQEAKSALAALPSAYQSQRPLLRTLKGIKNEIQLREGV